MNDAEPSTHDGKHKAIIAGLVVGGTLVTVGPLAGLAGTIMGLTTSFRAVGETAADKKASALSEGIAQAMSWTDVGFTVAAVGGVIAGVCGWLLWRRSRARARAGT